MSVKYYCDFCGEELTNNNRCGGPGRFVHSRDVGNGSRMSVEVSTAINGDWSVGEFCLDCVFSTITHSIRQNSPVATADLQAAAMSSLRQELERKARAEQAGGWEAERKSDDKIYLSHKENSPSTTSSTTRGKRSARRSK